MKPLLRRVRRVARRGSRPATPPVHGPAGELTYVAVVNGDALWVSAHVPGAARARLGVVHRHRKEVRLLPAPTMADLAGQNLPADTLVATCRSADLLTAQDTGIWDLAVVEPGGSPRRLRVAERAQLYPATPVVPMARADGVVLAPYTTKDGRGAVRVRVAPPSVEVTAVVSEPGRLAVTLELCRWSGPEPTSLVLERRRGPGRVSVPLQVTDGRARVTVPLHLLAQQCQGEPASVWDVAVQGPDGRTRCGRTARDVADPRRVHRYATQTYDSGSGHAALVFRPYFTSDRHLAVEVDGTARAPLHS
ncbi:hypothetical protein [Geodermatophilus pulveris]|uniref:hypothetical protein n=1 Tax=Geodermatophilus pulveris TaxID=1564159 RepID=UPI000B7852D8|nr:hypothetical protein [Geodermatophilus pulveris]